MTCFVLPYETADGPANMALDEAMLEAVARDESGLPALLRLDGADAEPRLFPADRPRSRPILAGDRSPIVRRPTGGGAIWHHHELTYAITVPPAHRSCRPNTALYRAVHGAIAECSGRAGCPGPPPRRWSAVAADPDGSGHSSALLAAIPKISYAEGHKLVGSAQRRRGGAILQHGSILLARSPRRPELPGVCDVADVPVAPEYWTSGSEAVSPPHWALHPMAIDWPDPLRERACDLERSTYRTPGWTEAR